VIIEPLQGDGGLLPAHPIFMKKLYELCRKHGILFISEEVQQGCWRTGKMFGIEHYDIIPDGIIMGKSVGASLTLGCFMARSEIIISVAGNVLRVQPPLNIEPELLGKAFGIIDQAMDDYENGRISDEVLKYKAGW
jgi:4-aminobutyrate aminotransferase-like enzyme